MVEISGLTEGVTEAVSAELLYQVTVPILQVANKVELCPEQMVAGLADIAVGAVGVGFTVTVIFPALLLHPVLLRHVT